MTTMRTLITGSLRLINAVQANEVPSEADIGISLQSLNGLMDSMSNDLLNIYTFKPYRFPLQAGQKEYTLGPAVDANGNQTDATWVIPRPMRIEQAKTILYGGVTQTTGDNEGLSTTGSTVTFTFVNNTPADAPVTFVAEDTGTVVTWAWDFGNGDVSAEQSPTYTYTTPGSYTVTVTTDNGSASATVNIVGATASTQTLFMPLKLISDEAYADIVIRDLQSNWPTRMYDNAAYPLRTIRVWPVPSETYAVELWLWDPLATWDSLDDELNLPPGYERYLRFKLAVEIAPEFGKEVSNTVKMSLSEAEAAVKRLNQRTPVSTNTRSGNLLNIPRNMGRRH